MTTNNMTCMCGKEINILYFDEHTSRCEQIILGQDHPSETGLDFWPLLVDALNREQRQEQNSASFLDSTTILSRTCQSFASTKEDFGWGCGYRNIQTVWSSIQPDLREADVPGIASIQAWIEWAWCRGFDPIGAEEIGPTLLGKNIRIGTPECVCLFRALGYRAATVGFDMGSSSGQRMVDWVSQYYGVGAESSSSSNMSVIQTNRPPLFLQYNGHSRCCIGIQRRQISAGSSPQISLLVVDPSMRMSSLRRSLQADTGSKSWHQLLKKKASSFRQRQFEICHFWDNALLTAEGPEYERLKDLNYLAQCYR